MRVANWNPNAFDQTFEDVTMSRLVDAAYILKDNVVQHLRSQIGKGKTTGINRPVYRSGPYAGQPWTAREFGQLLKSIRVVQKTSKTGKPLMRKRNVRVYAGHYLAFYADIFEYSNPFMRPALAQSIQSIKTTVGAK